MRKPICDKNLALDALAGNSAKPVLMDLTANALLQNKTRLLRSRGCNGKTDWEHIFHDLRHSSCADLFIHPVRFA
jgi:hypothetical protein